MKWKDLSMSDKALLIKLGVLSGIRDIKLIRELYDSYEDTPITTLSDNTNLYPLLGLNRIQQDYGLSEEQINTGDTLLKQIEDSITREQLNAEQPSLFRRVILNIPSRPMPAMIDSSKVRENLSQRYDNIRKRVLSFKKYRAYGGYIDDPPFLQRILNNDNRSVVNWENNKQKATHKLSYAETPEGFIVYPEVLVVNGKLHDFTDPKYNHGKWDALNNAIRNNDTLLFSNELDALKYTQEYKLKYPDYFKQFDKGGYLSNTPIGLFLHKFYDGGELNNSKNQDEVPPRASLVGKVPWNPFNSFNRNYRGAPIYESDNFGDSFRLARIDEAPIFIWNGKAYNTDLKPNPLVEAARAWDTQGDLRKREFQKRIISDPEGTMDYFRKKFTREDDYTTFNDNWDKDIYIIDEMYKNGALGMPNNVIVKGANYNIGNLLWDYLNTTNLTYNQKLALMANSYKESRGWTTNKLTNGPAKGYYQMENVQFKKYQDWLNKNKLEDNIINETKYIVDLFENHRDKLITPISANLDIEDIINNYKDAEEAHAHNHRSAYMHRGYYTEDALRDWDEGDLDAAVRAMEALFEKAGKPRLEDRQKIAWLLSEKYK